VPVAPVLTLNEAITHPQATERGAIRQLSDPFIGEFPIPGQPPIFSEWSYNKRLKAPLLGEHNEEVLTTICGMDKKEILELIKDGVIVSDPTPRNS
jgi:crotonobetainyl-CoA:carnitine CoA-transferase CaiB-like acyl-CoA transferase